MYVHGCSVVWWYDVFIPVLCGSGCAHDEAQVF